MAQTITIYNEEELPEKALEFVNLIGNAKVIAFYGTMGAGKTTFIKALCKQLGVVDSVNSPTYAIIYEYKTINSDSIFHFDFYRINSISEAFDFGYEDYFYSGDYCFIEWPEKIEELLPDNTLMVQITVNADNSRTFEISKRKI